MTEAKHTPGPWIKRYADRVTTKDDTDGTLSIAHVYGWQEHYGWQKANRDLIAAAPDMFEALRPLAEYGAALIGQPVSEDSVMLEFWGHQISVKDLRNAAVAYARAKGEA